MTKTTIKLGNYLKPTPPNIIKFMKLVKTFIATIAGAAYFSGNQSVAFWLLVAGGGCDFISGLFASETTKV